MAPISPNELIVSGPPPAGVVGRRYADDGLSIALTGQFRVSRERVVELAGLRTARQSGCS